MGTYTHKKKCYPNWVGKNNGAQIANHFVGTRSQMITARLIPWHIETPIVLFLLLLWAAFIVLFRGYNIVFKTYIMFGIYPLQVLVNLTYSSDGRA